mmetsp:Transcript_24723/g.44031  ORF Transcript_24723/g.44031 Transcript_24723/m.44031 type:complete len:278 (+) Transcript_24723:105-938(+)
MRSSGALLIASTLSYATATGPKPLVGLGLPSLALLALPAATWAQDPLVFGQPVPDKETLKQHSSTELQAFLTSKGGHLVACKNCEKDELVDRVLETWALPPQQASSPDGKLTMDKEQFVANLKRSFAQHQNQKQQDSETGHELDTEDDGIQAMTDQMPDFEKVWADFSAKLSKGEIKTDSNGQAIYQVGNGQAFNQKEESGMWAFFNRYKTQALLMVNTIMLLGSQFLKRRNGSESDAKKSNPELATPGEDIADSDEGDEVKNSKKATKSKGKKKSN